MSVQRGTADHGVGDGHGGGENSERAAGAGRESGSAARTGSVGGNGPATGRPGRYRRGGLWATFVVILAVVVGACLVIAVGTAGGKQIGRRASAAPVPDRTPQAGQDDPADGRSPAPGSGRSTPPLLAAHPVTEHVDGFFSWALMDRDTGAISGSANDDTGTSTTESMIKSWISSDYLRMQATAGLTPPQQRLAELVTMIRDSDDRAAQDIYLLDGGDAVVQRMIDMCGMTGTSLVHNWWSKTAITAADATRLGLCVADGTAAGAEWTPWILLQMRSVRGEGRFGIISALPAAAAATTAIKNGWTLIWADGDWHVACLAVHSDWILAVLLRYRGGLGLSYGADICAGVTRQLMGTAAPAPTGAVVQPSAVLAP